MVGSRLEEMLVTAQRREQNIHDVSIAISAFSASFLKKREITNLNDTVCRSRFFYTPLAFPIHPLYEFCGHETKLRTAPTW